MVQHMAGFWGPAVLKNLSIVNFSAKIDKKMDFLASRGKEFVFSQWKTEQKEDNASKSKCEIYKIKQQRQQITTKNNMET